MASQPPPRGTFGPILSSDPFCGASDEQRGLWGRLTRQTHPGPADLESLLPSGALALLPEEVSQSQAEMSQLLSHCSASAGALNQLCGTDLGAVPVGVIRHF